jgi:hypothetical protein
MESDEYKLYLRIVNLVESSNAKIRAALQEKINKVQEENRRLKRTQTVVSRNTSFR